MFQSPGDHLLQEEITSLPTMYDILPVVVFTVFDEAILW